MPAAFAVVSMAVGAAVGSPVILQIGAVRDRIADLSALDDLPARDDLITGCERAYDLLVAANDALTDTSRAARHNIGDEVKAK